MSFLIPVFAGIAILVLVAVGVFAIMSRSKTEGGEKQKDGGVRRKGKGRDTAFKNANKKLVQNPKDPEALQIVGDVYYQDGAIEGAFKTYETLVEILPTAQGLDEFLINLRYGLTAMKLGLPEPAYKGLSAARLLKQDNFELNFNLGSLEFQRKNYDKAVPLLQQARLQDPEHPGCLRILGHSFFKMKKYKEAMSYIRKAMDLAPGDKESLYTLAECYHEANQIEQALKIFSHLRPDPQMGAQSCLMSGTINMDTHQEAKAIEDFEIGLRHQNVKPEVEIEIKYKLAVCYLKANEMGKALTYLRDIQAVNPSYRDVAVLIGKYQELNANKNLQIYTMAPSADFVALCRRVVMGYYARAKVKITSISVTKNDWADILAEVDTPKWSDLVMFRFIRTAGSIGEMIVREFHTHLKEVKAGKGICITIGNFTEEARRYTEARLIDLIEKERFTAILNTVDSKVVQGKAAAKKK
ncbi:MAG: tetratricopeptide repeat protein [Treponema sp.]|jgi:tetratricopeptide (TPR) repeat protein|nr:tetratricopeptide repeat protein [Treponema sp.]